MTQQANSAQGQRFTSDWREIEQFIRDRRFVLAEEAESLKELCEASLELAATNVFVEKAQYHLEREATRYRRWGIGGIIVVALYIVVAIASYYFLFSIQEFVKEVSGPSLPGVNGWIFTMWLARSGIIGTLVVAGLILLALLTRAFFHESISLLNRRHALRFGRLYVYLKFAHLKDEEIRDAQKVLDVKRLEDAFGWNLVSESAFKDVKLPRSLVKTITKELTNIIRAIFQRSPEKETGSKQS